MAENTAGPSLGWGPDAIEIPCWIHWCNWKKIDYIASPHTDEERLDEVRRHLWSFHEPHQVEADIAYWLELASKDRARSVACLARAGELKKVLDNQAKWEEFDNA